MPVVLLKLRTDLELRKYGCKDVARALRLKEWQETLVLLTILSKKYKVRCCLRREWECDGLQHIGDQDLSPVKALSWWI
jgi:hypothetical protein